jgi:CheY-like chemotaxis protein
MSDHPKPCIRQQELIEKVQVHLIRISELAHAIAAALGNGNENLAAQLDKQVESEFGLRNAHWGPCTNTG